MNSYNKKSSMLVNPICLGHVYRDTNFSRLLQTKQQTEVLSKSIVHKALLSGGYFVAMKMILFYESLFRWIL